MFTARGYSAKVFDQRLNNALFLLTLPCLGALYFFTLQTSAN